MCKYDCIIYACGHPRFRVSRDPQRQCLAFSQTGGYNVGSMMNLMRPVCPLTPNPTFANAECDSIKFVGGESNNVETDYACGEIECFEKWYADQQRTFKHMEETYKEGALTYHTGKTLLREDSQISLENQELLDATFGEGFRANTRGAPIWQAFCRFHELQRAGLHAVHQGGPSNREAIDKLRAAQLELNKVVPARLIALRAAVVELIEAKIRDDSSAHPSTETEAQRQRRWDLVRFWCSQQHGIETAFQQGKSIEDCTRTFLGQDLESNVPSGEGFVGVDAWWLEQRPARQI